MKVAKRSACTPKPLAQGTVIEKVAFLLKQGYQRTLKDLVKIIYPNINEHSSEFKSKYSYIRSIVAKMRSQLVHFHRSGRFRLVWQGQPVTLWWLIKYKREVLLGNNTPVPEWMNVKSFFNLLEVSVNRNGRKYVGGQNFPCTFEISRRGYTTIYVHDQRGNWEEWLEEELINHCWPPGLVWHVFEHLESVHVDEHMTINGFIWPRQLKGSVIKTPYGFDLKLGDGSHPGCLEIEFKTNILPLFRRIDTRLSYLLQMVGWVKKHER